MEKGNYTFDNFEVKDTEERLLHVFEFEAKAEFFKTRVRMSFDSEQIKQVRLKSVLSFADLITYENDFFCSYIAITSWDTKDRYRENPNYYIGLLGDLIADEESAKERRDKNKEKKQMSIQKHAMKILEDARSSNNGIVPKPTQHPLLLSFEEPHLWRNSEQKKSLSSEAWKKIRQAVIIRDNHTCVYCGFESDESSKLQVNHINGDSDDNSFENLETACIMCHMILHSGLWSSVYGVLFIYEKSDMSQIDIIRTTRQMRDQRFKDEEIIKRCGLENKLPWKMDLDYLSDKFGFPAFIENAFTMMKSVPPYLRSMVPRS